MLFLGVKPKVSHKWFRKTICSVDIILYIIFRFFGTWLYFADDLTLRRSYWFKQMGLISVIKRNFRLTTNLKFPFIPVLLIAALSCKEAEKLYRFLPYNLRCAEHTEYVFARHISLWICINILSYSFYMYHIKKRKGE